MASEVLLPKQGNSVESCIILEWKKSEGDPVAMGESIAEVETDKATFEVESTAEGVLLSRLVNEGDDVPVLTAIAVVGAPGEDPGVVKSVPATEPGAQAAIPAGAKPATESARGRERGPAISPRARRLAEQKSLSISGMAGSGPGGRIMVRDVESALEAGAGRDSTVADRPVSTDETPLLEEIPVAGVRKIIADRMRESLASTAQFTMHAGADARVILEYRARMKASPEPELQSVSINDLVMFAVSRTLLRFAQLNASFSDGVIRRYRSVNLGFAVDTERGLMVPVIRNAHALSLVQLASEAHRLAEACKKMKAKPDDLDGATFSVTNLGVYGIQSFTPVLDAPQVGILGVGSIEPKPVVDGDRVDHVPTLGLSLTIDHQVVDGAPGARFLKDLADSIANFDLTLAQ